MLVGSQYLSRSQDLLDNQDAVGETTAKLEGNLCCAEGFYHLLDPDFVLIENKDTGQICICYEL